MLCDRVVGRWPADDPVPTGGDAGRVDWLDLGWDECHRRALRKVTRSGRPVRLLLRLGTILRHGDVLADAPDCLLVVCVRPVEALVACPRSIREAAAVAAEWGNLHVPVQITADEIITVYNGPPIEVLLTHKVPHAVEVRRFEPMRMPGMVWDLPAGGVAVAPRPVAFPAR